MEEEAKKALALQQQQLLMQQRQQQIHLLQRQQQQQQQQQAMARFPSNIDAHLRAPGMMRPHLLQPQHQPLHLQQQQQQQQQQTGVKSVQNAASGLAGRFRVGNSVEAEMVHQDVMNVCNPDFKRSFASVEDAVIRYDLGL